MDAVHIFKQDTGRRVKVPRCTAGIVHPEMVSKGEANGWQRMTWWESEVRE
jgi:hypothetical protein